jgi:hypothetical protein
LLPRSLRVPSGLAPRGVLWASFAALAPGRRRAGFHHPVCCVGRGLSEDQGRVRDGQLRRGFRRLMQRCSGGLAAPGIKGVETEGPWPSSPKMEVRGARMRRDAWKTPRGVPSGAPFAAPALTHAEVKGRPGRRRVGFHWVPYLLRRPWGRKTPRGVHCGPYLLRRPCSTRIMALPHGRRRVGYQNGPYLLRRSNCAYVTLRLRSLVAAASGGRA